MSECANNQNAANVACKHMGHISGTYVSEGDTQDGSTPTYAWNIECNGTESSLNDCSKSCCNFDDANFNDVGVTCVVKRNQ